ncbi:MAG: SDR family NAD(P)-dependent oxidoreductase [Planctomycetes bacterium]|nr:SDR family NAD(P)-dependent oxidoreductase [Planctomycetota bacterium]
MGSGSARAAVVTGTSSGIGAACVELLVTRGWRVFAGVRKVEDAERLAAAGAVPLSMDVTDGAGLAAAAAAVEEAVGAAGIQGLVNNAGVAVPGPLELLPVEDFQRQLDINLTGVLRCGQAFLPLLRAGRGRMVNISSMAGRIAAPMLGAYHASKWGLEGLSDSWRRELIPQGLWVALVEPGAVRSEIWDTANADAERMLEGIPEAGKRLYGPMIDASRTLVEQIVPRAIPAAAVAEAVLRALESPKPRTRYVVGRDARWALRAARWLPDKWLDRLMLKRKG